MSRKYIVIELSNTSFCVAQEMIGGRGERYNSIATCRSRGQAERIVERLNKAGDLTLELVREFHQAFGIDCPKEAGVTGGVEIQGWLKDISEDINLIAKGAHAVARDHNQNTAALRVQLIVEEVAEVVEAMSGGDIVQVLHELADLRYVVDGTVLAFGLGGVYVQAVEEIHRANMSKLDKDGKPILNEAGRVVKSDLFRKADCSHLIKKVGE